MSGHGHVTPNPDGSKARCGGPRFCRECAIEGARFSHTMPAGSVEPIEHEHVIVDHWDRTGASNPRSGLHPLDYQAPTSEERYSIEAVTSAIKSAWRSIETHCPPSAERTLALRALQEARSRANEAILGITIPR